MRIKILSNPMKQWAKSLEQEISQRLSKIGHKVVKRNAEATICIGGDGTILFAHHKGRIGGSILGIGGDKSYICQMHRDKWAESLEKALSGKKEKIMSLQCGIGGRSYSALNDIVIHATHYRVAEMDVKVGMEETSFEGDGMIISSALGSAAYAFSAGGAKLAPTERKISLVPICPYKRAFSPSVLPEDATIDLTVGNDCAFIIDGIFIRRLKVGEVIRIKKGLDMVFFEGVGKND